MKFCQPHWDALRTAITTRGLGHLVSVNDRDAFARQKADVEGRAEVDDFDPLIAACNMIIAFSVKHVGLYLLTGDYCPVCEFGRKYPHPTKGRYLTNDAFMIDGPADAVLVIAQEEGIAIATEGPT